MESLPRYSFGNQTFNSLSSRKNFIILQALGIHPLKCILELDLILPSIIQCNLRLVSIISSRSSQQHTESSHCICLLCSKIWRSGESGWLIWAIIGAFFFFFFSGQGCCDQGRWIWALDLSYGDKSGLILTAMVFPLTWGMFQVFFLGSDEWWRGMQV